MQNEILQKFLDQGLLDLGEDPEKFGYLTTAATDLAGELQGDRRRLIGASSILLGGDVDDNEPILELCKNAIKAHWPTYGSRFPSKPIQLFRAVLLQAIVNIAAEDSDCSKSASIFYTTSALFQYLTIQREDEIFRHFVLDLATKVESEAAKLWESPHTAQTPDVEFGDGNVAIPGIDVKALTEVLKAASGPSGGTNANPQWASSNNAEWMQHFGQTAASAIAAHVGAVLKALVPEIIAQSREDASTVLDEAVHNLSALSAEDTKAKVLYWKEALFSSKLGTSYRLIPPDASIYWAAWDLHALVPRIHPQSLEFFLRETVRSAVGEKEAKKKYSVEQFCASIGHAGDSITYPFTPVPGQRLPVLDAVEATAAKKLEAHRAALQTGIPAQALIARDEFAILLFRDMQVRRLTLGD